eukprot:366245-Chlamydomonas_euryale.AAC.37
MLRREVHPTGLCARHVRPPRSALCHISVLIATPCHSSVRRDCASCFEHVCLHCEVQCLWPRLSPRMPPRALQARIGDLTDPLYFDFISYAQYAVIGREMPNGAKVRWQRLEEGPGRVVQHHNNRRRLVRILPQCSV